MRNGVFHSVDKHLVFTPTTKRTQIFHWFRNALSTTFAYGIPGISPNQLAAINGSGNWRTFAENGREFLFYNPDGVNDSMVTIVPNVRTGKYRIEVNYKAGGRGDYQLMYRNDLIGAPVNLDDSATHATPLVQQAIKRLRKEFPQIPIQTVDERYTSKLASQAMVEMGMKKKDRRQKGNIDQIAATLMLQEYLQQL